MTIGSLLALTVMVALGAWLAVAVVRGYALRSLLDIPNERSSHAQPTPRGGGLGLAVAHLSGVMVAGHFDVLPSELVLAIAGGGVLVAAVGFVDDHGHVPAALRLTCHVLAFGWAVWWLGGLPPLDFGFGPIALGWVGTGLLLLYLAWFLNLFNFMDGIDGIAGAQALSMSLAGSVLACVSGCSASVALPALLLAAASAGFLAWNWPPARIFMGDVGSGYLGFALGVVALWTTVTGCLTPWAWLILGGAFLADATVTLFVRARTRVALAEAHRSHAYQRLSRYWGAHRPVTLAVVAVNAIWLGPWAWVATRWPSLGAFAAAVALTPLFIVVNRLGAGRPGDIGVRRPLV